MNLKTNSECANTEKGDMDLLSALKKILVMTCKQQSSQAAGACGDPAQVGVTSENSVRQLKIGAHV